jgi:transposase-like protein
MASSQAIQERIRELVAEVLAEEKEGSLGNIDDIEDAMIRVGDQVAREFGVRALAQHTSQAPEHPPCPDCGHAGEHVGPHTRELITRRGQVPVTEAKYRCPKCRRHFFPSDRIAGT